jgi:hypothetical protein
MEVPLEHRCNQVLTRAGENIVKARSMRTCRGDVRDPLVENHIAVVTRRYPIG